MKPAQPTTHGGVPAKFREPDFKEILARLAAWPFPAGVDGVVAIASGGVVPGALVAQRLGVGMKTVTLSYRDDANEPQFEQPKVLSSVPGMGSWRKVLLVDDLYMSGKSWHAARALLPREVEVLPFVFVGESDFALFKAKATGTVQWPWNPY